MELSEVSLFFIKFIRSNKAIYFLIFFEQVYSERHSSKSLILLQIIPFLLTNLVRPPPFLYLSRLVRIYPI